MYAVILAIAIGQPQAPPMLPEQAPTVRPIKLTPDQAQRLYDLTGAPWVRFVGQAERKIDGAMVSEEDGERCVWVYPAGDKWAYKLNGSPSNAEIQAKLWPKEVGRAAAPFRELLARRWSAKRDDLRPVPAVRGLGFLADLEPYQTARYTQEIAVTNNRDRITPIHRRNLETRWQVPGGLDGLTGWTSQLFRSASGRRFVADIPVWNGSNYQNNRGWKRRYDDGTVFADVLSTDAGVFEVRVAEKQNGEWQRYVAYSDVSKAPIGYRRLSSADCRKCHAEAGTGNYAAPLVPGGDTVFSDPYPELENMPG